MRKLAYTVCVLLLSPATNLFAERHSVIVLSQGDHTVYDVNPSSGQVIKQCTLGGAPREAILSWDSKALFVSVPDAGHVAIIDMATFKEKGKIAVKSPRGLATTVDGAKLYVGVEGGLMIYDSRLSLHNPTMVQAGRKVSVSHTDGQYFKIQTTTDKLYYPHRRDNQVVVLDTKRDAIVKTIPVAGGPLDVLFLPGDEVWVKSEDGSITVIDSGKDQVARTFNTGGKGPGRIAAAADIRYVASTYSESGDTAVIHPIDKSVMAVVKTGAGSSSASFAPEAKGSTSRLYVTNSSDSHVAVVDLSTMKIATTQKVGNGLIGGLIHYTFPHGWGPPRESTAQRLLETDLFTAYANAMFNGDVSPVHEHRSDLVAIFTGTGVAKIGCWSPTCPPDVVPKTALPYSNSEGAAGTFSALSRGVIHQEEGVSPSPRRGIFFDLKNNYYRQTNPPRAQSLFASAGLRKLGESARATAWDLTLLPGAPFSFPDGDVAVVYLGGGLLRFVREGRPEIVNRYFNDWSWEPRAHTVEAISNPMRVAIVEFK
jgi:DNA-binding beta-propeller fold protein YncE